MAIVDLKYDVSDRTHYKASGADVAAHEVVVIGTDPNGRIGIAAHDIADGETGTVYLVGVWKMPLAAAFNPAPGDPVYWDVADGELNSDSVNNSLAGHVEIDSEGNEAAAVGGVEQAYVNIGWR